MSGMWKYLSIALLISVCTASNNLWGQATAQISGTARDQSGAVLPGVEIKATQTETGVTRDTVTNETGSYVLPNLPPARSLQTGSFVTRIPDLLPNGNCPAGGKQPGSQHYP